MQISYSELRQNLKHTIDKTADLHEPAIITTHQKPTAVIMSYDDYCSLEETAYLLRSPANAKRLLEAILEVEQNNSLKEHGLLDDTTDES